MSLRSFISRYSFTIGGISLYIAPLLTSFILFQALKLYEKTIDVNDVNCGDFYQSSSFLLGHLDILNFFIFFIGAAFCARVIWGQFQTGLLRRISSVLIFIFLVSVGLCFPSIERNVSLSEQRIFHRIITEIDAAEFQNISVRLVHRERQINMFFENRDFDIYEVQYINNVKNEDSILEIMPQIKILVGVWENANENIYCTMVLSKKNKKHFYLANDKREVLFGNLDVMDESNFSNSFYEVLGFNEFYLFS